MNQGRAESCLPECFLRYPGAVLELSPEGVVLNTNGHLERSLERALVGEPLAAVLEDSASLAKWRWMLERCQEGTPGMEGTVWELVFTNGDAMEEPRTFAALREDSTAAILLIEQRADPRMDRLRDQVVGVNTELADAQRQLLKERAKLAYALEQLEAQHRMALQMGERIQRQNLDLERSNQALDEFAQVISHDLRAPLRSIANHARWIEEDTRGELSPETTEHLDRLKKAAARLTAMVNGVLAYARAGRAATTPEPVDSREVVLQILELLDTPADLEISLAPEMPEFIGQRPPFQQVMLNLLTNALRFADPDHPRLAVGVRTGDEFFEFSVADNGPGIPVEDQERIWNLFDTGRAGAPGGTGLGLAITRKLVEQHNGRAWVESRPGEGATFRFHWPKFPLARSG